MQFRFQDQILDPDRRELTRGPERVSIGPKVFDLLLYLLRNRERVVTKDDLLASVWNGRIVSESTLTSHINAARRAVGDTGGAQRLIRTVARKGFRFVGQVEEQPTQTTADATMVPLSALEFAGKMAKPLPALVVPEKPSMAVLPFQNMSGDPEQEYFADGIVEDIITALSRMRWLFVIARNSSFTYKGRAVDVKQVGRELGVRYVLEGSVRKSTTRIRISGQLIDTYTGASLWAERFDGSLQDIFELQDEVTASVVGAIAPKLEQAEIKRARRKPSASLDAYDYFLRGMERFYQHSREATGEALNLFSKAIELDPDFATPYAMAALVLYLAEDQWLVSRPAQRNCRRGAARLAGNWAGMMLSP